MNGFTLAFLIIMVIVALMLANLIAVPGGSVVLGLFLALLVLLIERLWRRG